MVAKKGLVGGSGCGLHGGLGQRQRVIDGVVVFAEGGDGLIQGRAAANREGNLRQGSGLAQSIEGGGAGALVGTAGVVGQGVEVGSGSVGFGDHLVDFADPIADAFGEIEDGVAGIGGGVGRGEGGKFAGERVDFRGQGIGAIDRLADIEQAEALGPMQAFGGERLRIGRLHGGALIDDQPERAGGGARLRPFKRRLKEKQRPAGPRGRREPA